MEALYKDYKDIAAFYIVYIREAHAADSSWPVDYAKEKGIKEHTTYGERCAVAEALTREKKLTIPCLIDDMQNTVGTAYAAWPDRIYVVGPEGRIGVAADRGPRGFGPGLKRTLEWLESYRKSMPGTESGTTTQPSEQVTPAEGEPAPERKDAREDDSSPKK